MALELMQVLVKPLITEKSTLLQEEGKYVFHIAPTANKTQVKQAVQTVFDVKVVDVNICKTRGKLKRFGLHLAKTADTKKAVVTLQAGDRIQLIEGL